MTRRRLFLDREQPFITCAAGSTKNRRDARQYIHPALAEELRKHVATKAPGTTVFAMPSKEYAARMLRADLKAARRAWLKAAQADPEERQRRAQSDFLAAENHDGESLDFHALRHTCGAWLALNGAHPNAVKAVMRHSTITLTMDTYGHLFPGQEAETVARLPQMLGKQPETFAATGTMDIAAEGRPQNGQQHGQQFGGKKRQRVAFSGEKWEPVLSVNPEPDAQPQLLATTRNKNSRQVLATAGRKAEGKGLERIP